MPNHGLVRLAAPLHLPQVPHAPGAAPAGVPGALAHPVAGPMQLLWQRTHGPLTVALWRVGSLYHARAVVTLPSGPLVVEAYAARPTMQEAATYAARYLGHAEVQAGFFGNIVKGIRKIARSKALRQVLGAVRIVGQIPAVRQALAAIPGAGPVFEAAQVGSQLLDAAKAGDPEARGKVRRMLARAKAGDPKARAQREVLRTLIEVRHKRLPRGVAVDRVARVMPVTARTTDAAAHHIAEDAESYDQDAAEDYGAEPMPYGLSLPYRGALPNGGAGPMVMAPAEHFRLMQPSPLALPAGRGW